ncbi:hypothetical protein BGW41_008259 [Actinomortierella wolfii]|nr:hypothetical protein BGW41_008259 [Actinomortierella wolfii]
MAPSATQSTLTRAEIEDRMRGCLFGNAIGDAYGLATEFMSKARAQQQYGNGPIKFGDDEGIPFYLDTHRGKWEVNDFTDDTDQMLVILQSLEQTRDGTLHPINLALKLQEWSKIGHPENNTPPRGIGFTVGSVLSHPLFTSQPFTAAYEVWDYHSRNLAPNGAVMRTSILGLESFWDEEQVVTNALAAAKVTHADPRSIVSAMLASVLISRFLRGGGQDIEKDQARLWNVQFRDEASKAQYRKRLLEYLLYGTDERDSQFVKAGYENASRSRAEDGEDVVDSFVPKDVFRLKAEYKERRAKEAIQKEKRHERLQRQLEEQLERQKGEKSEDKGILQHIKEVFKPPKKYKNYLEEMAEWNQQRGTPTWREDIGWRGIDGVGADEAVTQLARSVLDDYGFLVRETELVPHQKQIKILQQEGEEMPHKIPVQERWYAELEDHLFPRNLDALQLGQGAKIGYTFKCIGSGWYAVTRKEDPQATQDAYRGPSGLFRGCLEQVTLEAGDADTNCAVAGALLGARFGLQQGIPVKWYEGVEHHDWLNETFGRYIARVLDAYEAACQQSQE